MSNSIKYDFIVLNLLQISGSESLFVKLKHVLNNRHLIIGVIYRHPQNDLKANLKKIKSFTGRIHKKYY